MTHNKTNEDIIIWNPKNEKGIQFEVIPIQKTKNNSVENTKYCQLLVRMRYYMVQHNTTARGRLIGTCLPDVIQWNNNDLYQLKKECHRLINWVHQDYFVVGPSNNPLLDLNAKYELYYWPTVDEYPRIALEIPASTNSNGDITLYLDPKSCFIDTNYSSLQHQPNNISCAIIDKILMDNIMETIITINFVAGYDDLVCGQESSLGSRRFQRQIIPIPTNNRN